MSSEDGEKFRIECSEEWLKSFVGFAQILFEKTATTRRSTALVAYPMHVDLMNVSSSCRRRLMESGLTLPRFTPVSVTTSENSRASHMIRLDHNLYWFTGTNEKEIEETRR